MTTYYLKAADEASLWAALAEAELAYKDFDMSDENNQRPDDLDPFASWEMTGKFDWVFSGRSKGMDLDLIGTMTVPSGNTILDAEGEEVAEMVAAEGFHANLRADFDVDEEGNVIVPESLPIIEAPSTPYRKWAGE